MPYKIAISWDAVPEFKKFTPEAVVSRQSDRMNSAVVLVKGKPYIIYTVNTTEEHITMMVLQHKAFVYSKETHGNLYYV